MTAQILVFSANKSFKKSEKDVRSKSLKILKILGKERVLAEIFLVDSRKIRALNKKYRGKDKTTNILSFPEPKTFPHPEQKIKVLGEIYLNLPYINKEARQTPMGPLRGKIEKDEWLTRLLIHGLLHLFGYTHSKKSDRIKMEKQEKEVFKLCI